MKCRDYVANRREFYREQFCPRVNDPYSIFPRSPDDPSSTDQVPLGVEYLYNQRELMPHLPWDIPEDPRYPVDKVAAAIKYVIEGEENGDSALYLEGATLLKQIDDEYKTRRSLEIFDEGPDAQSVDRTSRGGKGKLTHRIGFGYPTWVEGYGYIPWIPSPEDLKRYEEWLDPPASDELALLQRDKLNEVPLPGGQKLLEGASPGLDPARRARIEKQREAYNTKRKGVRGFNESIRLVQMFRDYLERDRNFVQLGVCRYCGALYVKMDRASRYCSDECRRDAKRERLSERQGSAD